jgi:hypothetical protein
MVFDVNSFAFGLISGISIVVVYLYVTDKLKG